jgi:hypothetical protein
MHNQTLLPDTMAVTLEAIEALEEASARLLRALRRISRPQGGRDAGTMEYDSWHARSPGALEYDSWRPGET